MISSRHRIRTDREDLALCLGLRNDMIYTALMQHSHLPPHCWRKCLLYSQCSMKLLTVLYLPSLATTSVTTTVARQLVQA